MEKAGRGCVERGAVVVCVLPACCVCALKPNYVGTTVPIGWRCAGDMFCIGYVRGPLYSLCVYVSSVCALCICVCSLASWSDYLAYISSLCALIHALYVDTYMDMSQTPLLTQSERLKEGWGKRSGSYVEHPPCSACVGVVLCSG